MVQCPFCNSWIDRGCANDEYAELAFHLGKEHPTGMCSAAIPAVGPGWVCACEEWFYDLNEAGEHLKSVGDLAAHFAKGILEQATR